MAIGLSNVNGRKAKRTTSAKTVAEPIPKAAEPVELKTGGDAWSTRGLAREGRSARKERASSAGDLNTLWLDWSNFAGGAEASSRMMRTVRRILDLEMFVFEFLVYDLQIPMRAKKRILEIRSKGARALELKKLLGHRRN
ncbi:hypothetical protein BH10BDE1_BH10BDE1_32930 [soil metagenome]